MEELEAVKQELLESLDKTQISTEMKEAGERKYMAVKVPLIFLFLHRVILLRSNQIIGFLLSSLL